MREGKTEVKKAGRAEKAARRKAIKSRRRAKKAPSGEQLVFRSRLDMLFGGYDFTLALLVVLLSSFGVAMVFSAGYYQTINSAVPDPTYYLFRQLFFVVTGLLIMLWVAHFDYHHYMKLDVVIIMISLALLVLVMLIGTSVNESQRWIDLGFVRITPSEISKVAVIIFTASYLAKNPDAVRSFKGLLILTGVMAAHFILIIRQPNLSTAIVIVAIMGAIMLVAGLHMVFLILPALAGLAGYFYIITAKTPMHWYRRITSFMDPFADRQGDGYQVTQGLIALGNGGLRGLGFGRSVAKNLYLPEPQNDFILAVIGEELGYIGFVVLMAVYIVLLFVLIMSALRAKDRLGFFLATGVAVMLGLQVIINVAVVTSSMPATGITLPFISYGGTSVWAFMAAMGIVLNVSRKRRVVEPE